MQPGNQPPTEKRRKILMVLGGCFAAVLVVVGIAHAVGLLQAITCAANLYDAELAGREVTTVPYEFARALQEGDAETAYEMLGQAARAHHSPETLRAEIAKYEAQLGWSMPFPVSIERSDLEDATTWQEYFLFDPKEVNWSGTTYFLSPTTGEELALTVAMTVKGQRSDLRAVIEGWEWHLRTDDLMSQRMGYVISDFATHLVNGDWETAARYLRRSSDFGQDGGALQQALPTFPDDPSVHVTATRPLNAHLMKFDIEVRGPDEVQELTIVTWPTTIGVMEVHVGERRSVDAEDTPQAE